MHNGGLTTVLYLNEGGSAHNRHANNSTDHAKQSTEETEAQPEREAHTGAATPIYIGAGTCATPQLGRTSS